MNQAADGSRLRYLDASDVDDSVVNFDGLDVLSREGEKLGDIDGFLIDPASGRVLHAVIDSGGWFTSRRFLLPIGHASAIDREAGALRCDVSREALRNYPRFDEQLFREFTNEDSEAFERSIADACCPDDAPGDGSPQSAGRRHHQQPQWWRAGYAESRLRPVDVASYGRRSVAAQVEAAVESAVVRDNPGAEGMQDVLPRIEKN